MVQLGATTAFAEKRVALVIGNGAYINTTPLANPANDAGDMVAALKIAGFDVVQAVDADKRKIDQALRTFTEKMAGADVALFFYAGHGLQVGAQNYLVPIDAKLDRERDVDFEAVKLEFVLRQMEIDREGKTSIVILDACRDNPLSRNLARTMGTRSTAIGRGLAAASTGLGTFIAYATQPGNVALDGDGRNSPFTSALVKHMSIKGRNLPATMIEVRKDVVAATNGRQVPWDHSALTGDFYFQPGAATAAGSQPAMNTAEFAAMQERLRKLEDDAKKREATPSLPPLPKFMTRAGTALKGEQLPAPPSTANCETRCETESKCVGWQLARDGICELFSKVTERAADSKWRSGVRTEWASRVRDVAASVPADVPSIPADVPLVLPKATKPTSGLSLDDDVRIDGEVMSSSRAPNADACRTLCDSTTGCFGFQHGRKSPQMGQCQLFSRIDKRQQDNGWQSGVRADGTASTAAKSNVVLVPPQLLGVKPQRVEQGFNVYSDWWFEGAQIKVSTADSSASCAVVCRNTQNCIGANYARPSRRDRGECEVLSTIESARELLKTAVAGDSGGSALLKAK